MIQVHYSQRIKDLREDKKKTQKEIAEITMSHPNIF